MTEKIEDIKTPVATLEEDESGGIVVQESRKGFLPIVTNWFDRLFISVVIWVALSLFWMRFFEPLGLSLWISNIIAVALALLIISRG